MKDLIRYFLLVILFCCTNEQYLYAQEKTGGERSINTSEEKPTNSSAYRPSSASEETTGSSFNREQVITEIKAQMATMANTTLMELVEFCRKNFIQGEFVVDLTIEGKGKVLTVFMVSDVGDGILKMNLLKNKLAALQFDNVRIPKKERVKLRCTLNL